VREFIRFAIGRGWLTQEWAAPKYLKIVAKAEPKEPFSDEDVEAIFEATQLVTDRGKTGRFNSKELLRVPPGMRCTSRSHKKSRCR
jgi:hypothetical protein